MKRLAVIPARGGSTRLKGKNIYPLGGKPLIRWSAEAALASGCFDTVMISTDSEDIFKEVSDLPVVRHIRPPEHATVRSTALDAMVNLMENEKQEYDIFSYFLPTCPFVTAEDIQKGVSMFNAKGVDFVVSMTQIPETIQLACVVKDNWVLPVFDNLECGLTNSKFIKKYYKPSGAFYMGRWDEILKHKNFFTGNTKGVMLPRERSVDIDDIFDIEYAEQILKDTK